MNFLVIEGLDGSGKSTQIGLLKDYLKSRSISFEYLHFPRTDSPYFGELVSRFLRGEFGRLEDVHPWLVAVIYAGDRYDAKKLIRSWLDKKKLVIADRYVYSNIAYQCAKLNEPGEQQKLKKWILDFEYNYYQIPRPGLSLFLDVPFLFTKKKLTGSRSGTDRSYLKGKKDIHEADLPFQEKVRQIYLSLAKEDRSFRIISCSGDGQSMLAPEIIFGRIREELHNSFRVIADC